MRYFALMALGAFQVIAFFSFVNGQTSASEPSLFLLTNNDPAISYAPSLCRGNISACFGAWWDTTLSNGTSFKTTGGPFAAFKSAVTSLTFPFQGTSVEVHGLMDTQGAMILLQLDDQIAAFNSSTGLRGQSMVPALIHTFNNLDANTTHTLTVEWAGTGSTPGDGLLSFGYFDHLIVGNYRAVVSPVTPVSATPDTPPNQPPQTVFEEPSSASSSPAAVALSSSSKGMSGGATAGVVISILIILALLVGAIGYQIRLRRRPLAPSEQFRIFVQSRQERRVEIDEPISPSSSTLKARPHMSLPPVYEYYSKGESSYLDLESQNSRSNSEESQPGYTAFHKQFSSRLDLNVEGAGVEDKRKTAVSALSIPASTYQKDSDMYSVKMCTLSRPRIAQGAIIAPGEHVDYDTHPGLPEATTSRRSVKKRSRQSLGTRLSNNIRKSMKRGAVPPVPPLPTPPGVDFLAVESSSRSIMSRRSCPPPYVIE